MSRMNLRHLSVIAMAGLLMSTAAEAEVLTFVCVGQELVYPKTHEDYEQSIAQRPTTVRLEVDRQGKTVKLHGTAQADGTGSARTTDGSFATSYAKTLAIFGVTFKHVLISLPQDGNKLAVMASTHPNLESPGAEGRALFVGTCRLPARKD